MNCIVLIFSKDRALQLDATLRSFLFHCNDVSSLQIRVLYTASNAVFEDQYEQLRNEYNHYKFIQFIREQIFSSDVIALLAPFDYVLFLVDDNIFVRDFNLSEVIQRLEGHPDCLGFSLRLGKNTQYCYTLDKEQRLPEFDNLGNNILEYNWTTSQYDFGYPLELSSSVYRVEDILPFISQLPFRNPNTLEVLMDQYKSMFQKEKPSLLCYEQSVTFCVPMNIVQTAWSNRSSVKVQYSPDNLAKLFDDGVRIDISAFNNFTPNSCHQEVEFQFIDKAGKHFELSLKSPLVSIIILNYNGLEDIQICLDSIKRNTPENHEIIIVDNASTDGSLDYLRSLPDIILIENPTNVGCPPARAQAMSLAKGDYVILLDNDTIVTKGWITKFISHAQADPLIGMMGPRSNYVSGPQIVAEATYRTINELEDFAGHFAEKHRGELTPTVRLVGFCMFIRREVIDRIGSIDASFGRFGFEDDDFTWRAHIAGFKAVIANDVFIHHTGGPQGRGSTQYNQLLVEAWDIFKKKWDLPQNLECGYHCSPYYLKKILTRPFDLQKHYIPLGDRATVEKLVYVFKHPEVVKAEEKIEEQKKTGIFKRQVKDLVSIVILISNHPDYIRKCVKSIEKYTPQTHEIIFVPTGSSHENTHWVRNLVKEISNYKLIETNISGNVLPSPNPCPTAGRRASHQGMGLEAEECKVRFAQSAALSYPQACNRGIIESSGEFVVLLNDDVVVTEGWLSGMLEHLKSDSDTGIVSPMTIHIDGPQGVKEIATHPSGARNDRISGHCEERSDEAISRETERLPRPDETGPRDDRAQAFARAFRERNRYRRIEVVNINGFCMLFKKDLTKKIGLMDERLEISDFADNDYCLRAATEGYRNLIAGDVFVHTQRDRTLAGGQRDIGSLLPKISKIFFEKWNSLNVTSPLGKKVFVLNSLSTFRQLAQKGKKDEAVKILFESYNLAPENRQVYYSLSELLIEDKRFKDALEVLETMPEALREDPDRFERIGYCKALITQLEEAEYYADKALSLESTSAKALCLKGIIAHEKGNNTEAEQFFNNAIESDRGFGEAYYHLGVLKREEGKSAEAFELFERAFVLSPTVEDIFNTFCDTAVSPSQCERAEKVLKEAEALYPFHKKLKFHLADLLLKQEKNHEAMHILEDTLLVCGIDDDTLSFALKVREKIGSKEINKDQAEVKVEVEENNKVQVQALAETKNQSRGKNTETQKTQQTQKTTISLCMIVKNEESNLVQCLSKIQSLADEMIVVDTGSSDRTKDIAKAFGAKVFDFPWSNDFSEARNFSISKASGKWILVLDADEVISPSDHKSLRELIKIPPNPPLLKGGKGGLVAYSFTTRNYMYPVSFGWSANDGKYLEEEAGTGWVPSKKVRLFPNAHRICFENPVHELVENSLMKAGIEIKEIEIPVHHYGKLDTEKKGSKGAEYYDLGKIKLEKKGEQDTHALYELAVQAMELEKYEEALRYWQKLTKIQPEFTKAFIGLGNAYFQLKRYNDAVASLRKALSLEPHSRDVITLYAKCEICAGNVKAPISLLEDLFKRDPSIPTALGLLAIAYFCSDRKREGFLYAEKLQETNFNAATYFVSFARNLIMAQQFTHAIALLEAAIEGNYVTNETYVLIEKCKKKDSRDQRNTVIASEAKQSLFDRHCEERSEAISRNDEIATPPEADRNDKKTTILSLCMIVKNEEDNIERCISSVNELVNEIIVVDTGSSDRTKEIARRLGAKVYDFVWTDSFSDARNFALSKASGEWILILDADEVISPSDCDKLKKLIGKPDSKTFAYSFTTRNYVTELNTVDWIANDGKYREESGTGWFPGEKVRLFPNKPDIRFEYPVHERIELSLERSAIKIQRCDIYVHHYGTLEQEKEKSKAEAYYALARKKLYEQGSNDVTALHELAVQAATLGKHEEALEYLEKLIILKPDFSRAFLSMGNNYFNLRRYNDALSSYNKALEIDNNLKDAVIQSALCEIYTGNFESAVVRLEEFVKKEQENLKALALLTVGYLALNRKSDGLHIIEKLKVMNFDYAHFISNNAKTLIYDGKTDNAISLLQAAIDLNIITNDTHFLLDEASTIKHLNAKGIKTSLIVIVSSHSENLRKCVATLEQCTPGMHELILVPTEPSSTAETWLHDLIKGNQKYKLIQQENKLSHAAAYNIGIKEASGNFVALLTDDVIVTEGWLTGLLEHVVSVTDTGIVGPMSNDVEGPQGVKIATHPSGARNDSKTGPRDDNDFARSFRQKNRYRRVNFRKLQGFCLLLNSTLIEGIGLFDEQFNTSEYAIEDYGLRAIIEGYKTFIAGDVFVQYTEDRRSSDVVVSRGHTIEHNKALFTDRKLFVDKWSTIDIHSPSGKKLFEVNTLAFADDLNHKGQKHDALVVLLEGLKYVPDSNAIQYALLELLIENRNYNDALDMIEKMTEDMKRDPEILELAGHCKEGLGLYDEADRYAEEAISLNGASAKLWNLKGLVAYKKGILDEAEKLFRKAIELDRSYGEPYANLGAIKWNTGNRDEAFNFFERAFILSPIVESIAINYHASAVLSQLERAEMTLKDTTTLYPSNKRLKNVLVDILLQEGKYQEAMNIYEEAMLSFGIDDDNLSLALGIRDKVGPKEIATHPSDARNDKKRATISVCMIVKNEGKNIATCLHSIAPLADEMIVVDTGSDDRTKDIAKAFGAKVYNFQWTGDFSEARNFSLSKAAGEWILVLDADEVIAPFDQEVLKKLLNLPEYRSSAFTITTRNYVVPVSVIGWKANDGSYIKEETGTGWFASDKVRIFPNNPHIRFEFPVHEFVELSLQRTGIRNVMIEIPWHHYGKLEREKILSKGEDYYIQGKLKLSERGEDDLIALYELGVQASELERFDEALQYFEKLSKVRPDFPKAFFGMANSYYRLGKFREAFESLEEALKLEKDDTELKEIVNLHASCALSLGKAESSIPLLESVLQKNPDYPMAVLMIALVYCALNRRESAKGYIDKLRSMRMPFENYLHDFAVFLMSAGRADYALPIIEVAMENSPADNRFPVLLSQCQQMLQE